MHLRTWIAAMALVTACDESSPESDVDDKYMDDDVPSGNCMSESGPCDTESAGDSADDDGAGGSDSGSMPIPTGGICESTMQCGVGDTCIATFDGDIGEFECQSTCIDDHDEARWCLDDLSCCNGGSVCSARGYCQPSEEVEGSTTGTDGANDSTSDSSSSGTGG